MEGGLAADSGNAGVPVKLKSSISCIFVFDALVCVALFLSPKDCFEKYVLVNLVKFGIVAHTPFIPHFRGASSFFINHFCAAGSKFSLL